MMAAVAGGEGGGMEAAATVVSRGGGDGGSSEGGGGEGGGEGGGGEGGGGGVGRGEGGGGNGVLRLPTTRYHCRTCYDWLRLAARYTGFSPRYHSLYSLPLAIELDTTRYYALPLAAASNPT